MIRLVSVYHSMAPTWSLRSELGNQVPRCGGPLHLRRRDRLLHQRADQVAIARGAGGDGFWGRHVRAGLHVDLVQPPQQNGWLREPKRLTITGQQRQRLLQPAAALQQLLDGRGGLRGSRVGKRSRTSNLIQNN